MNRMVLPLRANLSKSVVLHRKKKRELRERSSYLEVNVPTIRGIS